MGNVTARDSFISFRTSQGSEHRADLARLARHQVVVEIHSPASLLQTSEVLSDFRITLNGQTLYAGRAVIRNLVDTGSSLVCEATLEDSWLDVELATADNPAAQLGAQFSEFIRKWQDNYRVLPEFKALVADMQSLLTDLRIWLEQVELAIRSSPGGDRLVLEKDTAAQLGTLVASSIDSLWGRFEPIASCIEPELEPVHCHFLRRHLHPLLLCSPFAHRAFNKPLGFPGDYEVVEMIVRNQPEGGSLFAKMLNFWLLQQPPSVAHRNRLTYLYQKLIDEAIRVVPEGRTARILNLGCGPACEVQRFLAEKDLADRTAFTLIDFSNETVHYTGSLLHDIRSRYHRTASVDVVKKSVQQIIKEGGRSVARPGGAKYDLIYCAGLFDYLPDGVCQRLLGILYEWLSPGGLLLATNVDATRPFYLSMEYMLDWHLICRNGRRLSELARKEIRTIAASVQSDLTGVNIFLELRKPKHAQRS